MPSRRKTAIDARIAQPCRMSPTTRPKASTDATGMRRSAQISRRLVQAFGILERVRRIGVEEAAAVGAELLDDLLARDRPDRDRLLRPLERRRVDRAGERLRHAERDEREREDEGDRQEEVERDPGDVDPEIADRLRRRANEAARQRESHREARRGGQEIVDREAEHLGEMTHRRLAGVVLPVRVGDEARRGVEGEVGRDRVEAPRIERQHVLQPLQRVERQEPGDREDHHRDRVAEPILFSRRIDAGETDRSRVRPVPGPARERSSRPQNSRAMKALSGTAHARTRASVSAICSQPTSVIAKSSGSEFFGSDQGVEEVEAEQHGHHQSDDRFGHRPCSLRAEKPVAVSSEQTLYVLIDPILQSALELPQAHGVKPHQSDDRKAQRDESKIQHDLLLKYWCRTAAGRKVSIPIGASRHKDFIRP